MGVILPSAPVPSSPLPRHSSVSSWRKPPTSYTYSARIEATATSFTMPSNEGTSSHTHPQTALILPTWNGATADTPALVQSSLFESASMARNVPSIYHSTSDSSPSARATQV